METLFQKEAMIPYENLKIIVYLYVNINLYINIKYYIIYIVYLHREWQRVGDREREREIASVNSGTLKTVNECFDLIKWGF